MPFTDFLSFKDADEKALRFPVHKNSLSVTAGLWSSTWNLANEFGANPTTAAIPTAATTGAVIGAGLLPPNGAAERYITTAELNASTTNCSSAMLVDRVSHQGGLSGIVATAQTTNLPTAALTRYTSGEGVMAALEIYSAVGATATTATMSYTNQAGTSGRTSQPVVFGGTGNNSGNRFFIFPLAAGDTGVRAVASVTLAASTLTAGNFGVTLFYPLGVFPNLGISQHSIQTRNFNSVLGNSINLERIEGDACLSLLVISNGTTTGIINGAINIGLAT